MRDDDGDDDGGGDDDDDDDILYALCVCVCVWCYFYLLTILFYGRQCVRRRRHVVAVGHNLLILFSFVCECDAPRNVR